MKSKERKILEDMREYLLFYLAGWHNEKNPRKKYNSASVEKANLLAQQLANLIAYGDELEIDIRNEETKKYIKEN